MLDRAGKGKQNGGKAGETKCRRADWVAWLERVSPSSMMWVRRTHGYQRREAESGSGGAQCSPIQLWVSRKEVGTFTKKNKQKQMKKQGVEGSPLRKARWESGGWTTRMSITTCTKKPHTDPRVLAMASESDTNLMFAAKKTNKQNKTTWTKHEAQVHLLASLLCMRGMTQCMGWSVSEGGRDILYCSQVCDLPNNG